ncbi:MAG: M28 family peptidase [Alphaproteobacteria bacterium]|nr:M28 family peptidase [Alphaproteobacteria bacterium]
MRTKLLSTALGSSLVLAALIGAPSLAEADGAAMLGFTADHAARETAAEARFDSGLSASDIDARLKLMSALPNQVGSPHDKENAEYTLAQFKAWGWDAHIEVFNVLYPTPKFESLTLEGDHPFTATLTEPPIPGDASSSRQAGALPAYLAYAGEGDVTAPLVYVNYGMPADYAELARLGVDVKGKIVIVRYGAGWRGLKPKLAYEHGAIGCIIYSDPADDGYGMADPYPKGPARPERGLQRGSVLDMAIESGDPLTPGYGAVEGAPRIARADAKTILKIPAVPISWGDAQHFLEHIGGPQAPASWRGALPFTYHVGGDGPKVHLVVQSNWDEKPLYDVIAVMKGAREPDQWVIRGNHRDGWVFGAQDPLSGQSALMEEAKSLGALAKTGWRPARTIIYASWDGEEPGLLGSTEWAEAHDKELKSKAVVYVNSDTNDRGFLGAEASYSLESLLNQAAGAVTDPETGVDVRDRAIAAVEVRDLDPHAGPMVKAMARVARTEGVMPVGDMGSGSDYTPFVQHLGVASINIGFGGEGSSGGVYHSVYDTYEHYTRFGDPGMKYGVALAEVGGRLIMRAADADLDPYAYTPVAQTVGREVQELKTLLADTRNHAETQDALLKEDAFKLAADPTKSWSPPPHADAPPTIDFGPLDAATQRLAASAKAYDAAAAHPASDAHLEDVDALLQRSEQDLTDPAGLPNRPWYQNLIYAPGVLTGYGAKTLPGVREAIEGGRWAEAQDYVARTAKALDALSDRLDKATRLLTQ